MKNINNNKKIFNPAAGGLERNSFMSKKFYQRQILNPVVDLIRERIIYENIMDMALRMLATNVMIS
jgi:hypothetical protein